MYDSEKTQGHKAYIENANERRYEFIDQIDTIQIFSSEIDNNTPLETDDFEKFQNIKNLVNAI